MSISDRSFDARLSYGTKINPLVVLMAISMIIFVVLAFFNALAYLKLPEGGDVKGYFEKNILCWFALSADSSKLLTRPWTLFTCAFTQESVWQLLASIVWLWCFGYIFMDLTGYKKIVPVFLYGALAGAISFLLANYLVSSGSVLETAYFLGSSTAILAVCAAATTTCPYYKVFPMLGGGISLWILSVVYLVIDIATLPPNNPVLCITHLAGALAGFAFIFLLRKGIDGSEWMNRLYDWALNLFNPEKEHQKRAQIKSTFFYKTSTTPFTKTPKLTQQRLDEILDKINQRGYEHLSTEEKEFLKRASEEDVREK